MKFDSANKLEEKIRIQVESLRIRLQEYFIDYDRLRSGYVTRAQFHRVLDQLLRGSLSEEEILTLADKYNNRKNSTVCYRDLCNNISNLFPENEFQPDPEKHVYRTPEFLGTFRSVKQLDESQENELNQLLVKLNNYYSRRNFDVLTCFRDFDRNKNGTVTENQFRRGLVEPHLSEDEWSLLIRKYQHPDAKACVNYLNFHNDLMSLNNKGQNAAEMFKHEHTDLKNQECLSIQDIVDRISIACHKEGIRIVDFFRDYDRLRSGVITDRQFATGLSLGVKKAANLCNDDISQLCEYYRIGNEQIDYKSFADSVENFLNIPDQEKKPLAVVKRPPRGLLSKNLNGNLSAEEEQNLHVVLEELAERVRKYKIQLFPYFKDYDRSKAFTRNVTKIQFGRVLSTLNIMPSNNDFQLLLKKFEDPVSGDINYPAFCQVVDEDYVGGVIENEKDKENSQILIKIENKEYPPDITTVDMNELMARIRSSILGSRIRIKEHFQDFDPLNSGCITKAQFIRCLSSIGLSSLGSLNLNKTQMEALCNEYKSAKDSKKIDWRRFEYDIESVFTLQNLEKNPTVRVAPTNLFVVPAQGTVKWDEEKLESSEDYNKVISNMNELVKKRRIDCWPPFKDFDKLNRGHVTRSQFHQCLSKLGIDLTPSEISALEAKYLNKIGFNYVNLLNRVQPLEIDEAKYFQFKQELEKLNYQKSPYEVDPITDVRSILIKVKDQVFRNRISIYEWLRDHDKLNSGRILRETFKRAFDLCNIKLFPSEVDLITNYYNSTKDSRMVEYKEFCREIETAFGLNDLEKNPLLESNILKPKNPIHENNLTPDEEDILREAINKLAHRVRTQRIQLFPKFEDFDQVKNGNVSQNQFRRVLNDLSLATVLHDSELNALMKKFCIKIGTRNDFNYVSFCDNIYEAGSFEYRLP